MALVSVLTVVAATTFANPPPASSTSPGARAPTAPSSGTSAAASTREAPYDDSTRGRVNYKKVHDDWLLSVEAATHLPVDVGFQAGVETPFGLRVFGGYGWVPAAFIDVAGSASGRGVVHDVLDSANYSGDAARVTLGIRPFRKFGGYLDAGYAHLRLDGSQDVPAFAFQGLAFPGGSYLAKSSLNLWLVELGYQAQIAGRLVLAAGVGLTGAIDANTRIEPRSGAPNDPALSDAARQIDHALETNVLPTLTLRVGFDVI